MTEEDYNKAIKDRDVLIGELKTLNGVILQFENSYKTPEFNKIEDIKNFIMYDSVEGSFVKYEGIKYSVGDYSDLVREYGYDSTLDSMGSATMKDLVDGGVSILTKIDKF